MSDNNNNNNNEPEKKVESAPDLTKFATVIDQQTIVIESQQKELISLKTDMKDLREGLGPLLQLAEQIKQAQSQQQQVQKQQNQGSANGLPLPMNFDINAIKELAIAAGNIIQSIAPILQQTGLLPSGSSDGLTTLLLDNNKRFNKWVDLLVNKTLTKAIGLTLSATEQQLIESTGAASHMLS